jgi:pimeloyl-ACP methyl ester carboxylesterase
VVAYRLAALYPGRLERLVILNSPHPATLARGLLRNAQALRSAYMLPLMVPGLAERAFAARDGELLRRALRAFRTTRATDEEIEPYVEAARQAEWLRGGLDAYRAMGRALLGRAPIIGRVMKSARPFPRSRRVDVPVLVIWGEADPALAPHLAEPPRELVPDVRVERIANASHDVMLDAPERVNALLLEFLASGRGPPHRAPAA